MGTSKRERQKANRLQRQAEEARAARVGTVKRTALRWGVGGVLALGAVVFIAWLGGAFNSDEQLASVDPGATTLPQFTVPDVTPPSTTTPPPAPPKPDVSIPDAVPTELVVTDLVEGTGPAAKAGDTVLVYYAGVRTVDGVAFEDNYSGAPFAVQLGSGSVIDGWDQGLIGIKAGGRRQLDIPADLAYGDQAQSDVIRAGEALTFVIDAVAVTPAAG